MNEHLPTSGSRRLLPRTDGAVPASQGAELVGGEDIDLRDIWATIRRRRRAIGLTVALVLLAVAAYTIWAVPVWYAHTLIRVDDPEPSSLTSPAITALTGLQGGGSQIETELRILGTRPIAEEVVDALDLHFVVTSPREVARSRLFESIDLGRETVEAAYEIRQAGSGRFRIVAADDETPALDLVFSPGDRVDVAGGSFVLAPSRQGPDGEAALDAIDIEIMVFQEAVEEFFEAISTGRPNRDAKILQVGYRTTDPVLVHEVPNLIARTFIRRRIDDQKTDARNTVGFLSEQVEETRAQLEAVEEELRNFREGEQIVALSAEAEAQVGRLATLEAQRTQLEAERAALAALVAEIDAGEGRPDYRQLVAYPTFLQNDAIGTILLELNEADQLRGELRQRLTDDHPDVVVVQGRIDRLEEQLGSIARNYLASLARQVAVLDAEVARFGSELEEIPEREIVFARIERQVEMLAELYTVLQGRLKEAQVKEAIDDSSVRIVERAIRPLRPVSPKPVRNMVLALVLGLILGLVVAFVRDYMDRRLHSSDRIEVLYGLPTMARIPALNLPSGPADRSRALIAADDMQSVAAESFRALRTNVRFVRQGTGASEIVITSPSPGEGKSLTAANLAITLAQQGQKTVLLDADMRRPTQHLQFEVSQEPGLSDCLLDGGLQVEALRQTHLEFLSILPAGRQPPNPAELLDSRQMESVLEALRDRFEAVVIDSPPILAVTDSAVLAPKTDGVILVVRAERTDKDAIALAIQQMRQVGAELLGVVVNDAKAEGSYQAYYNEFYGQARPAGWRRWLARLRGAAS